MKRRANLVRYRPAKGRPDSPAVRSFPGAEFVGRMAALIPPARKHLVRYYGALGPRTADHDAAGQSDPNSEQWDARQDWPAGDWPA